MLCLDPKRLKARYGSLNCSCLEGKQLCCKESLEKPGQHLSCRNIELTSIFGLNDLQQVNFLV